MSLRGIVPLEMLFSLSKKPNLTLKPSFSIFLTPFRCLNEIGIEKDIVFHTLRACLATHLLASGAEVQNASFQLFNSLFIGIINHT